MQYLIVCDHRKEVIESKNGQEAMLMFKCSRCVRFDMKASKWRYKNLRVYVPSTKDLELVGASKESKEKPKRYKELRQLDWVTPK